MADLQRVQLVLVGPHAGKTFTNQGRSYVNGVAVIDVRADQAHGLIRSAARNEMAFPAGSRELLEAEDQYHGSLDSEAGQGPEDRGLLAVPRKVLKRSVNPAAKGTAVPERRPDGASGSAVRDQPDRDRYADARIHREAKGREREGLAPARGGPEVDLKLAAAVRSLDCENDDLWTVAGLPKLSAVEEAYGSAGVTREDVEAVLPEWDRDAALTAALDALA